MELLAAVSDIQGQREDVPRARRARIVGDNPQVVRYGAAQARLRVLARQEPIDEGLEHAARLGWDLEWQLVRRRLNDEAHQCASAAARWAASLLERGSHESQSYFDWGDGGRDGVLGLLTPAWPLC